jgi:hypothetical protein
MKCMDKGALLEEFFESVERGRSLDDHIIDCCHCGELLRRGAYELIYQAASATDKAVMIAEDSCLSDVDMININIAPTDELMNRVEGHNCKSCERRISLYSKIFAEINLLTLGSARYMSEFTRAYVKKLNKIYKKTQ